MQIGIGLGLGFTAGGQGGGGYAFANSEASDLVARMSVTPSDDRKALIDSTFTALKSTTFLTRLDGLYFIAAHDAQAALLNWAGENYTLTAANSPTFDEDRGYSGDGSTSYLDTNANLTSLANLQRNDGMAAAWQRNNATVSDYMLGLLTTPSVLRVAGRQVGNATGRANDLSGINLLTSDSVGLVALNRSGAGARQIYKNGVQGNTGTNSSSALTSTNICLLRDNTIYSAGQIAFAAFGASLDETEHASLYSIANTYLQAVGAA